MGCQSILHCVNKLSSVHIKRPFHRSFEKNNNWVINKITNSCLLWIDRCLLLVSASNQNQNTTATESQQVELTSGEQGVNFGTGEGNRKLFLRSQWEQGNIPRQWFPQLTREINEQNNKADPSTGTRTRLIKTQWQRHRTTTQSRRTGGNANQELWLTECYANWKWC